MSYADDLLAFAAEMHELADNLGAVAERLAQATARRAVELVQDQWPVDTGYSRDQWSAQPLPGGASIVCIADYSSYVFEAGDITRTPIYPQMLGRALRDAAIELDWHGTFQDVTAAYVGQGRTTAHLTGVSRKFLIHTPKIEQEGWRKSWPHLIESVTVTINGVEREMEAVPSDTVAGGAMGGGYL